MIIPPSTVFDRVAAEYAIDPAELREIWRRLMNRRHGVCLLIPHLGKVNDRDRPVR
jgi:hypothetical protein